MFVESSKPGNYDVLEGRAKKVYFHECPVCKVYVEAVFEKVYLDPPALQTIGPAPAMSWKLTKFRCPECLLMFDLMAKYDRLGV